MAFYGKEFKLEKQEKMEDLISAFGTELSEEQKKAMLTHKPTLKVTQNGDTYTLSSSKPDGSIAEVTFKSGVEFDDVIGAEKVKSCITVDGNVFTQVQKHPKGSLTIKREFTDNELVATITSSAWDNEAKRYYKA